MDRFSTYTAELDELARQRAKRAGHPSVYVGKKRPRRWTRWMKGKRASE